MYHALLLQSLHISVQLFTKAGCSLAAVFARPFVRTNRDAKIVMSKEASGGVRRRRAGASVRPQTEGGIEWRSDDALMEQRMHPLLTKGDGEARRAEEERDEWG